DQHRVGERREVSVVTEQDVRRNRLGDLEQRAAAAQNEIERVPRLLFRSLPLVEERIGKRRIPQGEDEVEAYVTAGPTSVDRAHELRNSRYHAMVRDRPSSRVRAGFHPKRSRAFLALRYCRGISFVASLRISGFMS